jgi:hypothetical protein
LDKKKNSSHNTENKEAASKLLLIRPLLNVSGLCILTTFYIDMGGF